MCGVGEFFGVRSGQGTSAGPFGLPFSPISFALRHALPHSALFKVQCSGLLTTYAPNWTMPQELIARSNALVHVTCPL